MDYSKKLDSAVPVTPKLSALAELELMVRARITMQTEHTAVRMRGTSESKVLKQRAIKVSSARERVQRVVSSSPTL
jgi:hypothetical protein